MQKNEVIWLEWFEKAEKLKFDDGLSWTQVMEALKTTYKDLTIGKVRDYLRSTEQYKKDHPAIKRPVGVFSDPHIPFDHPNYLQFVIDTFKHYKVGQVICAGDLVDHHALSRFLSETCAKGPYDELDMSIKRVRAYTKAFPKVNMCLGNHDEIPYRQAATIGIGRRYMKSFHEILELPKTWMLGEEFIIDNVLYKHGINCTGKDGALNTAINERMSTVMGHSHSYAGCKYSANKRNLIFGMNVGCGIDIKAYAFAYGKNAKFRPTLGCGIVFNESNAIFVPMGEKYFRHDDA